MPTPLVVALLFEFPGAQLTSTAVAGHIQEHRIRFQKGEQG